MKHLVTIRDSNTGKPLAHVNDKTGVFEQLCSDEEWEKYTQDTMDCNPESAVIHIEEVWSLAMETSHNLPHHKNG
jgi:hypothetical protein